MIMRGPLWFPSRKEGKKKVKMRDLYSTLSLQQWIHHCSKEPTANHRCSDQYHHCSDHKTYHYVLCHCSTSNRIQLRRAVTSAMFCFQIRSVVSQSLSAQTSTFLGPKTSPNNYPNLFKATLKLFQDSFKAQLSLAQNFCLSFH